jgi:hypothetical protein
MPDINELGVEDDSGALNLLWTLSPFVIVGFITVVVLLVRACG